MSRLTPPVAMQTKSYVRGVETVNGFDAWRLFEASAAGDMATARALLAKDRRLVNAQFGYRFPIHWAVFAGKTEVVRLLLQQGADPGQSIYTYDSWDKLLASARARGNQKIESLLEHAMRKRFQFAAEFDVLKDAIIARDARRITAAVRRRPDVVLASDALGNNALHWSVITRQLDWIRRFVELGTPIDAPRADGQTPILLAINGATDYWYRATRGRTHPSLRNTSVLVGYLLAHGAYYSLSVAATIGDQERVDQLLAEDTELALQLDLARVSPLSYAARAGHVHLVRKLLEHGANPRHPEDAAPQGRALYEACCGNHLPVAELLLAHGADPNAGVDSCECCLTIARIYHGTRAKPLERLLRRHGATMPPYRMSRAQLLKAIREDQPVTRHEEFLDSVLAKGNRALLEEYVNSPSCPSPNWYSIASSPTCSLALLDTLFDRGLDPHQTNWLGKTLLHAAAEVGDRAKAATLLDRGADINARELEFQGTPLAAAVRAWCAEAEPKLMPRRRLMVEFLLQRGAATNLPDDELWATPMAWAKNEHREDIVARLQRP
ncbi:MAG: ankyrin repeat domain-containing protein [Pirellulaceae bacterium]